MGNNDWKSMSVDQLWTVHQEITAILTDKIAAERAALEERLREAELQPDQLSTHLRSGKRRNDL